MTGDQLKCFKRARAVALGQIRQDRERCPGQLARFFDDLADTFLEAGTRVRTVCQQIGLEGTSKRRFEAAVGCSAERYILGLRLRVAKELLSFSDLPIWKIAELAASSSHDVFRSVFRQYEGISPSRYRKQTAAEVTSTTDPRLEEEGDWARLRATLRGAGSRADSLALETTIGERLCSQAIGLEAIALELDPDAEGRLERLMAGYVREVLARLPKEDHGRYIVSVASSFRTPALFEECLFQSRFQGRSDRGRGSELAEIARTTLAKLAWYLDEETYANLQIRSLSWLASASKLVGNRVRAAEYFRQAEELARSSWKISSFVLAELYFFKSCLKIDEGQLAEARELLEKARLYSEEDFRADLGTRISLGRGNLAWRETNWEIAHRIFMEARDLLHEASDIYLHVGTYHNLATTSLKLGSVGEAHAYAEVARSAIEENGESFDAIVPQLLWLQGLISLETGEKSKSVKLLEAAQASFMEQGSHRRLALVSVDIALALSEDLGRMTAKAIEAFPMLEPLGLEGEALVLFQLLQRDPLKIGSHVNLLRRLRNIVSRRCFLPELPE